jgi:hypothetical protein
MLSRWGPVLHNKIYIRTAVRIIYVGTRYSVLAERYRWIKQSYFKLCRKNEAGREHGGNVKALLQPDPFEHEILLIRQLQLMSFSRVIMILKITRNWLLETDFRLKTLNGARAPSSPIFFSFLKFWILNFNTTKILKNLSWCTQCCSL